MNDWKQAPKYARKLDGAHTLELERGPARWVARCSYHWGPKGGETFSSSTHYEYSDNPLSALLALRGDMLSHGNALIAAANALPMELPENEK